MEGAKAEAGVMAIEVEEGTTQATHRQIMGVMATVRWLMEEVDCQSFITHFVGCWSL